MIRRMKNFWISLDETTVISKRELFLEVVVCALAGFILGMFLTPKKTVTIGSNNSGNGCHNGNGNEEGCLEKEDKEKEK